MTRPDVEATRTPPVPKENVICRSCDKDMGYRPHLFDQPIGGIAGHWVLTGLCADCQDHHECPGVVRELIETIDDWPIRERCLNIPYLFDEPRHVQGQEMVNHTIRKAAGKFAQLVVDRTPKGIDQQRAVMKIREGMWHALAAVALDGGMFQPDVCPPDTAAKDAVREDYRGRGKEIKAADRR